MRGGNVSLEVRVEDVGGADAAAHWLTACTPAIKIERSDGLLVLRSSSMKRGEIEDAWLCALTNERLLVDGAKMRGAMLADLRG